ncbi:MAG: LacI family DNA-binding transcriptional regulator [Anaerolineae bacterium]|nr:LacI family DNA-binding transcriptional regulator [Anaerolineae bacterium]
MKDKRSRLPTSRDVAKVAGVTATTVSYVLSGRSDGKDRISAETRQRILDAVKALGYVPNATARSLRKQRTDRIRMFIDSTQQDSCFVNTEDSVPVRS